MKMSGCRKNPPKNQKDKNRVDEPPPRGAGRRKVKVKTKDKPEKEVTVN